MKFKLDITKKTFEKNLVLMGFNIKINQYEDMIASIKRNIVKKITQSIENKNIERTLIDIFESIDIPLVALERYGFITFVSEDYIKQIINEGEIDFFIEEKNAKLATKETQKNAYKMTIMENLRFRGRLAQISFEYKNAELVDKNNSKYVTAKKCLNNNGIYLNEDEKKEVINEIIDDITNSVGTLNFTNIRRALRDIEFLTFKKNNESIERGLYYQLVKDKDFLNNIIEEIDFRKNITNKTKEILRERRTFLNRIRNELKINEDKALNGLLIMKNEGFKEFLNEFPDVKKSALRLGKMNILCQEVQAVKDIDLEKESIVLKYGNKEKIYTFKELIDHK